MNKNNQNDDRYKDLDKLISPLTEESNQAEIDEKQAKILREAAKEQRERMQEAKKK
jgi:hypothetical protein